MFYSFFFHSLSLFLFEDENKRFISIIFRARDWWQVPNVDVDDVQLKIRIGLKHDSRFSVFGFQLKNFEPFKLLRCNNWLLLTCGLSTGCGLGYDVNAVIKLRSIKSHFTKTFKVWPDHGQIESGPILSKSCPKAAETGGTLWWKSEAELRHKMWALK